MSSLLNNIINYISKSNLSLNPNDINNLKLFIQNNQTPNDYSELETIVYYANEFMKKISITKQNNINEINMKVNNEVNVKDFLTDIINEVDILTEETEQYNISEKKQSKEITTNINNILSLKSPNEIISRFIPKSKYQKVYVSLDSRYGRFSSDMTKITWDLFENLTETPNSVNIKSGVRDIVEMRLYSFMFKQFTSVMQRGAVLIDEFSAQSFISPSGQRWHFLNRFNVLNSTIVDPADVYAQTSITYTSAGASTAAVVVLPDPGYTWYNPGVFSVSLGFPAYTTLVTQYAYPDPVLYQKVELISGYRFDEGKYKFNKPMNLPKTLTLSVYDPLTAVPIQPYEYFKASITINYAGNIVVTLPSNHTFGTGYQIYSIFFSDFTTTNPVADAAIITDINTNEFTSGVTTSPNIITVNPLLIRPPGNYDYLIYRDLAAYGSPVGTPSTVTVRLTGYRIIFNLEFTYIDNS